jgi:hypothetical protein
VTPSLLEPDACADVDEGQVVVEDFCAQRRDDDKPAGKRESDDQEPRETRGAQVAPRATIQADEN